PFTLARAHALRPAEYVEEVGLKRLVREHDGTVGRILVRGQAGESSRAGRHLRHGVKKHLGAQPARIEAGERLFVVLVELVGLGRQLIGPAPRDNSYQMLEAEFTVDQL